MYNAVRRTTSPGTALVEGTGVLRTGVLENRRSGKTAVLETGVSETAVLGTGVPGSALTETGVEPKILGFFSFHLRGRFRIVPRRLLHMELSSNELQEMKLA